MAYGQTASGKSHTMGVLQGVDIAAHNVASSGDRDTAGPQETLKSPQRISDEEGMGGSNATQPSIQGYGKANGVRLHSHNQADPGIIPRALSRVFEHTQESTRSFDNGSPADVSPKVNISLLQIYNETVQVRAFVYTCLCWGGYHTECILIDPSHC